MWLLTGLLSVIFCILAGWMAVRKNKRAGVLSVCSLAFTAVTLLLQYHMVLVWVRRNDWSALLDVTPLLFVLLCVYVIVLFAANAVILLIGRKA